MARLIDADELCNELATVCDDRYDRTVEWCIGILRQAPTVDAVSYEEWFSTNCETCKEYDKEKHCCPKFRGVIKQTLKDFEKNNKLVRCKDCKHWTITSDGFGECNVMDKQFLGKEYCSFGERKTNGNN